MKLVILESPFAGDILRNVLYARACVRDALLKGYAPIASHLLYTQPGILDDAVPEERTHGIEAGLAWRKVAEGSLVYVDRGVSSGMAYGIAAMRAEGKFVIECRLPDEALAQLEEEATQLEAMHVSACALKPLVSTAHGSLFPALQH